MASIENSFLSGQIDLLDKILATSLDLIYVYDRAGRYLYANSAGLAILGLQSEDLLGKHWRELGLFAEGMERHDAERESVFQTGIPIQRETGYPTVNGIRYYEYVISPILGKHGRIEAVIHTGRDITQRKQAEDAMCLSAEELEARVMARTEELTALNQSLQLEIAERQKVEQSLQESEMRFQALVDAIFEGIVIQENGKIIDANSGFAKMFGYSLEEVVGKSAVDFLTPESLERVLHYTKTQYELPYEITGVKQDGTLIHLEVVGKQSQYQGRNVRVSAARDITDRKQIEATLQEKQAEIQQQLAEIETIYQSAPIGLNVLDTELRFVRINQRLAEINGLSVEAHIGRTVRELLPDLADTAEQLLRPILETGEPLLKVEITGETPAQPGVQRTWLESFLPLRDGNRIIGISTVCEEITERKRVEAELRERERLFSTLAAALPVTIFRFDVDSHCIYINDYWTAMTGRTVESAMGLDWVETLHPEDRDRLVSEWLAWSQNSQQRGLYQNEGRLVHLNGRKIWYYIQALAEVDANGETVGYIGVMTDISDRKQAEIALQQSEQRYRALVHASSQIVWRADRAGVTISAPKDWEELTGQPAAEYLGWGWLDVIHPDDREHSAQCWQAAYTNHTLYETEYRLRMKNGEYRNFAVRGVPLLDTDGNVSEWIGTGTDITEHKQAEAALQEGEAVLQLFAQYAPAGIAMFDREMRYVMTSQRWVDGYSLSSVESLIGRSHYEVFPEVPERWRQVHQRCLAGAIETCDEDLFLRPDGRQQWIRWEVRPWYRATDEIGGIIVFSEDITQRKQAEASVRQLNQELQQKVTELQTLLDVIPIGIGIAEDPECHNIRVNPAFAQELNIPTTVNASLTAPQAERPTNFKVYQNGREMASEELPLQVAAKYGTEVRDLEVEVVWQDGTVVTLLEYAAPLFDEHGQPRGSIGAFLNITGRKQAEQDLRAARDHLEQQVQERTRELRQLAEDLQRSNQELEQFAYVASHDLQEPLRAVTSFTQMLAKRYQGQIDARADTYIEFIVDGATRMQQLIRDLLAYSRTGRYELKLQPVDLNAVLERVKQDLQVAIAESGAIITADPLPTLRADPNQIANLLQNLVGNSLKYRSEAVPQIHISARIIPGNADAASSQAAIPSAPPVREWLFSIQDNGIGIEPQYAERIFAIFQRLHTIDEYSGTGLGLAICRKIVERHEGRIWVESQLGQGATFFFTIPSSMRT